MDYTDLVVAINNLERTLNACGILFLLLGVSFLLFKNMSSKE